MLPEVRKYLFDAEEACRAILTFIDKKTFDDYNHDLLLRSGVERQLMIVGEALNQAWHKDSEIESEISHLREIVNLRNVIIHGYSVVKNETIWGILEEDLSLLHQELAYFLD